MIQSFADATTQDLYDGIDSKAARRIPKEIWPVVHRKLDALDAATSMIDFLCVPGNHLKRLKWKQKGRWSLRVNQQYRITFRFDEGHAYDVRCEDYH